MIMASILKGLTKKLKDICIKPYYFQFGRPTSVLKLLKFMFTCLSEMDIVRIASSTLWLFYDGLLCVCI